LGDLLDNNSLVVYVDSADPPFQENEYATLDHIIVPHPEEDDQWLLQRKSIIDDASNY